MRMALLLTVASILPVCLRGPRELVLVRGLNFGIPIDRCRTIGVTYLASNLISGSHLIEAQYNSPTMYFLEIRGSQFPDSSKEDQVGNATF